MDRSQRKQKEIVEESLKTKKAREKLLKRLNEMDARITREAIDRKSVEIHRWISRNADRRIALKDKEISLFDENQNAAKVSLKVAKLAEKIQIEN
jgi:hypothetical protein